MLQLAMSSIADYRRHHARLPVALEVLLEPLEKNLDEPYAASSDLADAWGHPIRYIRLSDTRYRLVSLGADGIEGGEGEDADITFPDDFAGDA